MSYHERTHSETGQSPRLRYEAGKLFTRHVDLQRVLKYFVKREQRRVDPDFSDVRISGLFFRVDKQLRRDKVEVRYDPFGDLESVLIYSLDGEYLGSGVRHQRQAGEDAAEAVMLVLIRDPKGEWRDEFLLSTDTSLSVQDVLAGYCRRWSVEVAYADTKGMLGFHEPEVWCASSVQRAHPMAWFVGSLVVLWYVLHGGSHTTPQRHRPWYTHKPEVTFADMLATCRYQLWENWLANSASPAELDERRAWLMEYLATAA